MLIDAGCQRLGENRPQQLWEKHAWLNEQPDKPNVEWHFIGHLQRNKVRRTLPLITCLQALDSTRLADAVNEEAKRQGLTIDVLVDVNVTADESKTGLPASDIEAFVDHILGLPGVRLHGLMAMSSLHAESGEARREFAKVRELRDSLQEKFGDQVGLAELSMGMSGDFREAIMEGATMVRIGSNLWEGVAADDRAN
jgi:pyridoxal phosphate enzyme (YggS family)